MDRRRACEEVYRQFCRMMGVKEGLPAAFLREFEGTASAGEKALEAQRLVGTVSGMVWNRLTLPGQIEAFYLRLS